MDKIAFPGVGISELRKLDTNLPLPLLALQIAKMHLGVEEVNLQNKGPMVDLYLASVGLPPGNAWCMAFVFYCFEVASWLKRVANPLPKTGGTLECARRIDVSVKISPDAARKDPSIIKPGYVVIWKHSETTGHTGIIEKIENGLIYTIDGNTNDEGSREGKEVAARSRKLSDATVLCFIKIG